MLPPPTPWKRYVTFKTPGKGSWIFNFLLRLEVNHGEGHNENNSSAGYAELDKNIREARKYSRLPLSTQDRRLCLITSLFVFGGSLKQC